MFLKNVKLLYISICGLLLPSVVLSAPNNNCNIYIQDDVFYTNQIFAQSDPIYEDHFLYEFIAKEDTCFEISIRDNWCLNAPDNYKFLEYFVPLGHDVTWEMIVNQEITFENVAQYKSYMYNPDSTTIISGNTKYYCFKFPDNHWDIPTKHMFSTPDLTGMFENSSVQYIELPPFEANGGDTIEYVDRLFAGSSYLNQFTMSNNWWGIVSANSMFSETDIKPFLYTYDEGILYEPANNHFIETYNNIDPTININGSIEYTSDINQDPGSNINRIPHFWQIMFSVNNMFSFTPNLSEVILPFGWANIEFTFEMFANSTSLTYISLPELWNNNAVIDNTDMFFNTGFICKEPGDEINQFYYGSSLLNSFPSEPYISGIGLDSLPNCSVAQNCPNNTVTWTDTNVSGFDCAQERTINNNNFSYGDFAALGAEHCKSATFIETANFNGTWGNRFITNCTYDSFDIAFTSTTDMGLDIFLGTFEFFNTDGSGRTTIPSATTKYRFKDAYKKWDLHFPASGDDYEAMDGYPFGMFENVTNLKSITLPNEWGSWSDVSGMFYNALSLESVILPRSWGNVITTYNMFINTKIPSINTYVSASSSGVPNNLPNSWGNVENTTNMFREMSLLTSVVLPSSWDNVSDVFNMFQDSTSLTSVILPRTWGNIYDTTNMFANTDLPSVDTYASESSAAATNHLPSSWGNITNTSRMFVQTKNAGRSIIFAVLPDSWDNVTNASYMFQNNEVFNMVTLPKTWGSTLTNRLSMFDNTGFTCYGPGTDIADNINLTKSRQPGYFPQPPFDAVADAAQHLLSEGNNGIEICPAPSSVVCNPGYYLRGGTFDCAPCTSDSYCPDITTYNYDGNDPVAPTVDMGKTPCPTISDLESGKSVDLRTSGLGGAGADNANDCGRTLNFGENALTPNVATYKIFLKSGALPSGRILVVQDDVGGIYYSNMSTDLTKSRLKMNYQGTQYSIHTDN